MNRLGAKPKIVGQQFESQWQQQFQ
jgi:hypothetical protein